jgi:DNA repair ATPase RecN
MTVLRGWRAAVDIHGQHEFQSLMRSHSQRELPDEFGELEPQVGMVRATHAAGWRS